jgi:hypothetical protein
MGCTPTSGSPSQGSGGAGLNINAKEKEGEHQEHQEHQEHHEHQEHQEVEVHKEEHHEISQGGNATQKVTTTTTTTTTKKENTAIAGAIEQPPAPDDNFHQKNHAEQHAESTTTKIPIVTQTATIIEQTFQLEKVSVGEAIKLPMKAWFKQKGATYNMEFTEIEIGERGLIRLSGKDAAGSFEMKGRIMADDQVAIKKQYSDRHKSLYQGTMDMWMIEGKWSDVIDDKTAQENEFKIEFTLNKFVYLDYHYAFTSSKPCAGLLKTDQGWGVLKPDNAALGAKFDGTIYYVNGSNVKCKVNVDGETPMITIGEETMTLLQE